MTNSNQAERQVVGICLRYRDAVGGLTLRGEDFADGTLGRLFEATRLIPDPPPPPGPTFPDFAQGISDHVPMPDAWAAWLEEVEDWRPLHASRIVMANPAFAITLYNECGMLASLERWAREVESGAILRKYRLACSYALSLVDQGAEPEEIKAVLLGVA